MDSITLAKACRHTMMKIAEQSSSGHFGGSLSCIDYLAVLYHQRILLTQEQVVVSNGHISPAIYAILSECGQCNRQELIRTYRKDNSIFEGHINRQVEGVAYGTGPLGCGVSVAAGMALTHQLANLSRNEIPRVFALCGDGEMQEGQIWEALHFAAHHELHNLILFVDYNKLQLSGPLCEVSDIDVVHLLEVAGWQIYSIDAQNHQEIAITLDKAIHNTSKQPVAIIGHTTMGAGIPFMEQESKEGKSTWHGKVPAPDQLANILPALQLSLHKQHTLQQRQQQQAKIDYRVPFPQTVLSPQEFYPVQTKKDCRSAYGETIAHLATHNSHILVLTADLRGSVKTNTVLKETPKQHIECGIAEQNMLSLAGGISLSGYTPFVSTFAVFMSSRAKDQVRLNDINCTNVKMVATHAGLSVGEDGPTHQCIDDINSFSGLPNTHIIEPADANQTIHIINYIARKSGNFYVRMGRHKLPIIADRDNVPYFGEEYLFEYGKSDIIGEGEDITVVALGSCVSEAIQAVKILQKSHNTSVEVIALSSPTCIDKVILESVKKTKRLITVEDHKSTTGCSVHIAQALVSQNISLLTYKNLGVERYQRSATQSQLYASAGIDADSIAKEILTCTTV